MTGVRIMRTQHTAHDFRDAILLLEAPRREAPDLYETSRAPRSYGLILAFPIALIVAACVLLSRLTPALLALPFPR